MNKPNLTKSDAAAAAVLFLILFVIFIAAAVPAMIFEDTGEFAVSSAVLGVSHPPGYPLYLLFGHLFSGIPFNESAFGVVLFSCWAGAAGCCLVFAACRMLGFSRAAAWCAGILMGVSGAFWSQAVISEVYSLQLLLTAALFCAVVRAARGGGLHFVLFAALLLGLNFLNHYISFVAYAPVVAACFFFMRGKVGQTVRAAAAGLFIFLLAISIAMYLPLRSAAAPAILWGDTSTLSGFAEHLRRTQFIFWENQIVFHFQTKVNYLSHFLAGLPDEFSPVFAFAALMGFFLLWAERRKLSLLLAFLVIVLTVGVIAFINFHYSSDMLSVFKVFYIGSYMIIVMYAAAGIDGALEMLRQRGVGGITAAAAVPAVLLLLIWPFAQNLPKNDLRNERRALTFGRDVFRAMRRDAVFINKGAIHSPPVEYLHISGNLRPDVLVIDSHGTFLRGNIAKAGFKYSYMNMPLVELDMMNKARAERPVYSAFSEPVENEEFAMVNLGPVYRLAGKGAGCDLSVWGSGAGDFTPAGAARNFETDMLGALVLSRVALCDYERGDAAGALTKVKQIAMLYPGSPYVDLSIARLYLSFDPKTYRNHAELWLRQAISDCPTYSDAYESLGGLLLSGDNPMPSRAIEAFETAIRLTPNMYTSMMALAKIYQDEDDIRNAEAFYRKILEIRPDAALVYNNLGNLYTDQRRWDDALRSYNKAVELAPSMSITQLSLGDFYFIRNETGKAMEYYRKFTGMTPHSEVGWRKLGIAAERSGDYNNALSYYEKSADIFFENLGENEASDRVYVAIMQKIIKILTDTGRADRARAMIQDMRFKARDITYKADVMNGKEAVRESEVRDLRAKASLLERVAQILERGLEKTNTPQTRKAI